MISPIRISRAGRLLVGATAVLSCSADWVDQVRLGPDERADLVVVFRRDAPTDSVNQFPTRVLFPPDGRGGHHSLPGLQTMNNSYTVEGHRVMALDFHRSATKTERAAVRALLQRSHLVYRIVGDTAPAQLSFADTANAHRLIVP